uniref:sialomucin core protein 24-like isoform X2 n=1 Tax=Gasterosteus aculeatus aculeatus TaxID=481459 RepID=UPI001A98CB41|nr:sialomucin core protein 24-like isoform X2 [Gasterosteus aculeatus aculeatus]
MAMDTAIVTLACYLLAFSFAAAQKDEEKTAVTSAMTTPDFNRTHTSTLTPTNSTGQAADVSNSIAFSSTTRDGGTLATTTAAPPESTGHPRTSNGTSMLTTTTPPPPAATTSTAQTATGHTSTAASTATADSSSTGSSSTGSSPTGSSPTDSSSTDSTGRTTKGLRLNISEMSMTIAFSSVLGALGLAVVVFIFHKCKHRIQYLHQPLNSTGDADEFAADDDTLVISGGLYDGHPIYDNVPPVPADQSQFRLQFL